MPPTWDATGARLTAVTSPVQVLAVASYPLPRSDAYSDGCEPTQALDALPADGAFIYGWSYGDAATARRGSDLPFAQRPEHFSLQNLARYECMRRSYLLRFAAGGQAFQVHIAFGPKATDATRATALQVLDSFAAGRR